MFSIFKRKDGICRTNEQLCLAMIEGRVFKVGGRICKYNPVEPPYIGYIPTAHIANISPTHGHL